MLHLILIIILALGLVLCWAALVATLNYRKAQLRAYEDFLSLKSTQLRSPTLDAYRASIRRAAQRIGRPTTSGELKPLINSLRKQRITPEQAEAHRERVLQLQWKYAKNKRKHSQRQEG